MIRDHSIYPNSNSNKSSRSTLNLGFCKCLKIHHWLNLGYKRIGNIILIIFNKILQEFFWVAEQVFLGKLEEAIWIGLDLLWILWLWWLFELEHVTYNFEHFDDGHNWFTDTLQFIEIIYIDLLNLLDSFLKSWQSHSQIGISTILNSFDFSSSLRSFSFFN